MGLLAATLKVLYLSFFLTNILSINFDNSKVSITALNKASLLANFNFIIFF